MIARGMIFLRDEQGTGSDRSAPGCIDVAEVVCWTNADLASMIIAPGGGGEPHEAVPRRRRFAPWLATIVGTAADYQLAVTPVVMYIS